jgi:hypothetical protein
VCRIYKICTVCFGVVAIVQAQKFRREIAFSFFFGKKSLMDTLRLGRVLPASIPEEDQVQQVADYYLSLF